MASLEQVIADFEGRIVGGVCKVYGATLEDTKTLNLLYMPQFLIIKNWLGSRDELDFDADYNVSGMRLVRGDNITDLSTSIKPMLKRIELSRLIYDPRYIYEHYKDKLLKVSEGAYELKLDYDLGVTSPTVKLKVSFELTCGQPNSMRVTSLDQNGKETPHSEVIFDYQQPWQFLRTETLKDPDDSDKEVQTWEDPVDPANAWMQ